MKKIEAFFFDLDGTLVDSRSDIAEAMNHTFSGLGLKETYTPEEVSSFIGGGIEETVRKALGRGRENIVKEGLTVFKEYYLRHPIENASLYPGVVQTLEFFKKKKLAVVTNKDGDIAEEVLKGLGIRKYFCAVTGGEDGSKRKPEPGAVTALLKTTGIPTDEALITGDMETDISTGKNAGVMTCAALYGLGNNDEVLAAKPDFVINGFAELREIFF